MSKSLIYPFLVNHLNNHCNKWRKFDPPTISIKYPPKSRHFYEYPPTSIFTNPGITDLRYTWVRPLLTTKFTLDTYVHFHKLRFLWWTTFTLVNYVHHGQLPSLRINTFTLDNYVPLRQVRSHWTTTFTLDNYVHFGQLRSYWKLRSLCTNTSTLDK